MRIRDLFNRLNIYVDVECQVYCDFSLKGYASPNAEFTLFLRSDSSHILEFRIDGKSVFVHEYRTRTGVKEDTIKVQLARVLYKIDDDYIPYNFEPPKFLFIDTETTGLPEDDVDLEYSYLDFDYWPHIVQVAFVVFDCKWNEIAEASYIISPDDYIIPQSSTRIHRITHKEAKEKGVRREDVFSYLNDLLSKVDYIIGHNVKFDINVLKCEIMRVKRKGKLKGDVSFKNKNYKIIDTMELGAFVCRIPTLLFNGYKYPTLGELYKTLYSRDIEKQHNALADVKATVECYNKLSAITILDIENKCELEQKHVVALGFDTEDLTNFSVKYKEYESDNGRTEKQLVLAYTNGDGQRRYRRISDDSELTVGDIINKDTIEILKYMDSGKKTYRVDADILNEEQSGWELVSSNELVGIENVIHIYVVNRSYLRPNGHRVIRKSMCFEMNDGTKRFIPLCKNSNLDIADTVNIDSVRLYKYAKKGHARYGVDGNFEKSNMGHSNRTYINIFSDENDNEIKGAYVDSETRSLHYRGRNIDYEQLVIRFEFKGIGDVSFDLDTNSDLDIYDEVDPNSVIFFTYKENGKEYEKVDASRIEE